MTMRSKEPKQLTPEQQEQKRKSKNRLFFLLIGIDILMVIYLIYEIVTAFTK